jgi:predicted PurR-regulated permease PerM
MPFVIAAFLAYLGDPFADKLEAVNLSRTVAVIIVFTLMILVSMLLVLLVLPLLESQISDFFRKLPNYIAWINQAIIPWLVKKFEIDIAAVDFTEVIQMVKSHWQKAGGVVTAVMGSVSRSGMVIFQWLMNLVLIPVVAFYLLRDWDILIAKIHALLPRRIAPTATKLSIESDQVLSAFLRGQFYVMLVLGAIYSVGLTIIGLDLALLIGMFSGLVSFVPYLGAVVGIILACAAALVQFQELSSLIPVAIVFAIGQSLEGMLLTPLLVGDKIGLHPVAVMFAVLAGGQLFGFIGVLLALPVASVIMVLLRHTHDLYKDSDFYGTIKAETIADEDQQQSVVDQNQ